MNDELMGGILLPDGRTVDPMGVEYRQWCEAWWVLRGGCNAPARQGAEGWNRTKYFERVKKIRGQAGLDDLLSRIERVSPHFFAMEEAA